MVKINPEEIEIFRVSAGTVDRRIPVTPISSLPDIKRRAEEAQHLWRERSLKERVELLRGVARKLYSERRTFAKTISEYNGKPEFEALMDEIFPVLCNFDLCCKKAEKELSPEAVFIESNPFASAKIFFEPLGILGVISPWNFPFLLALADVPAALVAGNAVVIKPSEHAAQVGFLIEALFANFPRGLVQVIQGYGDLGQALIQSGIQKLSFTGSTLTGKKVYALAAQQMIPCSLELGGKDAAIILDDADLVKTVEGILWAGLTNGGQACASVEWVFFPKSQGKKIIEAFAKGLETLRPDDIGVMNTTFQKEMVESQVRDALEKGGTIFARRHFGSQDHPFHVEVRFLENPPESSTLFSQENFGPVISFFPYTDLNEVHAKLLQLPYGLTASIWTRDCNRAGDLAKQLDVGVVTVNDHMITAGIPETPWLGHRDSGLGFSRSRFSLRNFTKMKTVFQNPPFLKRRFWQFPYNAKALSMGEDCLKSLFDPSWTKRVLNKLKLFWMLFLR